MINEVFQHCQGSRIRPLKILQDEQNPGAATEDIDHAQHPLAEHDRRLSRSSLRPVPLRYQPAKRRPIWGKLSIVGNTSLSKGGKQRLRQRLIGGRLPVANRSTGEHHPTTTPCLLHHLANQPGLPDAGLAHQEDRAAAGRAQPSGQDLQFRAATDQRFAQERHHSMSLAHRVPTPTEQIVRRLARVARPRRPPRRDQRPRHRYLRHRRLGTPTDPPPAHRVSEDVAQMPQRLAGGVGSSRSRPAFGGSDRRHMDRSFELVEDVAHVGQRVPGVEPRFG